MTDYRRLRRPLSERLPIVTYTNRFAAVAETLWISPQVERITGHPIEEWVGRAGFFESVLHPDDREPVLAAMRESRQDLRAFSRDYRVIGPDGRVVWIHDESVPILEESGDPELIQGYFVDITERKELERQLLHSQKLEAVGRLTGGIAHDFNNFLLAMAGYTELALQTVPPRSPARRHLAEVLRTVESARAVARQLLGFSRKEPVAPSLVDLAAVVEELRLLLRQVAGKGIRLDLDLRPAPPVYVVRRSSSSCSSTSSPTPATPARRRLPSGSTAAPATPCSWSPTTARGWTRRPPSGPSTPSSRPRRSMPGPASASRSSTASSRGPRARSTLPRGPVRGRPWRSACLQRLSAKYMPPRTRSAFRRRLAVRGLRPRSPR